MRIAPRPTLRTGPFIVVLGLLISGCAYTIPQVDPADIPRLQSEIAVSPEDTDLQVRLGMAQYMAEDFDQALATLQGAIDAGNESGLAFLYLGMTHESSENWPGARDAYSRYLETGASGPLQGELRGRLAIIAQNVLRDEARSALAQEAALSGAEATPRSVAVFPFAFNSDREEYEPLIYALADMMITDFAISNALTVLERAQIQTLLDEMSLTETGYADAATGARAGRLLQAEHVVQGVLTTLGEQNIRVDTDVLNIPRAASAGTVEAEETLENLFDMEKDLVFRTLRDVLGVQLTPAEEQAIRDNRAENVLAFLAYGRGLRARDQGDYAEAAEQFQQAADLDPSFDAAIEAAAEAGLVVTAWNTSTDQVGQTIYTGGTVAPPPPSTAGMGSNLAGTGFTTTSTVGTLSGASNSVNPNPTSGTLDLGSTASSSNTATTSIEQRDPVQESQGQEGVSSTAKAQIRIVIKRPGGVE